ncbi:DUF4097 family beta strand repeat-containing protein [Draconibacterium halophilum]|uniref:Adhesin domain-containing protein n=1 Tax=Draconibacterium halophilum TaxID=2706887 RepID=A0A6C0RCR3_9BACT|nr:hypothetical protein [Draconibacterium halophilum]QIA07899.1 hypothetical protein G0Q07_09240 [Draconibacterium halophilum]
MRTLKRIAALFLIGVLSAGTTVLAEEKTKEFRESWLNNEVSSLEIDNRFGEVKINNIEGDSVIIHVEITVDAPNERKADELLDMIEVNIRKSGSLVKAVTEIERNFKSQRKFSIDYEVNIPSDKDLKINNKYGNTIVGRLTGNGEFICKYGNFTAYELTTPESGSLNLTLAYGNANIGEVSHMDVDVSYSPIDIEEASSLNIESKYSNITVEECKSVIIESKYDKFKFEELESLSAQIKYTNIKIEELAKSLKVESGYGGIKVEEVGPNFDFIDITNSYGQISLGLDDASYSLDASCDYCGVSYPEDEFTGNRIKDNHKSTVVGKVGSGDGGQVTVRSRYGDIKLDE